MVEQETNVDQRDLRGTLPSGTRLRHYELSGVLGQGGFGITYSARDVSLGRDIAIKEYLPTALAVREDTAVLPRSTKVAEDFVWGRSRFLEEARILASLAGIPAVVRVFDFLEANGTAYMVMALARGETLAERLKRNGKLPPEVNGHMLGQLLEGLEAVHHTGFLHRDIKPGNIILDASNNPTLIDFGASRASIAGRTAVMTAIYTPRYAAAEQLTSAKQGPWTDIYGVSATLYHAVTGEPPPSSLERVINDTHKSLTSLSPLGYPPRLLHGLDVGLAVHPADRPQTIGEWRKLLAEPQDADATVYVRRQPPVADESRPAEPAAPPPSPLLGRPVSSPLVTGKALRIARLVIEVLMVLLLLCAGYWIYTGRTPAPLAPHEGVGQQRQ